MKKNGFIATSLIYSFFLIFITLFLTIIADYLQQKVLLNEIEKGIKDDLNATMGIRDFEVGDLIVSDSGCTINFEPTKAYVVVNTDVNNNKLILYSYELCKSGSCSASKPILENFNDIPTGNSNATYYNKIIYNFDKTSSKTFTVGSNFYSVNESRVCIDNRYNTSSGCFVSPSADTYYRYRIEKEITDKVSKCSNTDDVMGAIYLDWSL